MKQFDFNNALKELKDLQPEQSIVLTVDQAITAKLEILAYRKPSLEELFGMALKEQLQDNSIEKITDIIEQYSTVNLLLDKIMSNILLESLGEEAFIYLRDPMNTINYYFNFNLNSIVISKHVHSCKTCD